MGSAEDSGTAPGDCFSQCFPLYEQFADATRGWELDFRQLGPADSPFALEQLVGKDMHYGRARFGCHFHQLGAPVLGFRTFALQAGRCTDLRWCGAPVYRHSLIVYPVSGEFESVSWPGFDIFTLSLSTALLERVAQQSFGRDLSDFVGPGGQVCHRSGQSLAKLRSRLQALSSGIGRLGPAALCQGAGAQLGWLEQVLAELLLSCLCASDIQRLGCGLNNKRARVLAAAMDIIARTPLAELDTGSLAARLAVSRRTLEYAFQDGVGVSPAVYFKAVRLMGLSRELLHASAQESSVASLCDRHGFSHQGQLAADYRGMFGERPSRTLRRVF